MTPTVGRIVHYYHPKGKGPGPLDLIGPWPAIITKVADNVCMLTVFSPSGEPDPDGIEWMGGVKVGWVEYSPEPKPGRWTWPPRVS